MTNYLKNIDFETVQELSSLVSFQKGQVISRTLAQNKHVSVTLFSFDQGEEISSHSSKGDAMIHVFEGTAKITIDDKDYIVEANKSIVMPAGKPHAVYAQTPFKMLLVVVFPE
ncbi:MAG TPA: cupin domain-containing protein [Clostridia bacterium]